jgi:hypothetical protein
MMAHANRSYYVRRMRTKLAFVVVVALAGCSSKKDSGGGGGGGTGSSEQKPVEDKPVTCPPGNVVKDGKCVAAVTAEKVEVIAKQQTRLDDLAKLLDKIDTVSAPIELLNAFRKLDEWKNLVTKFEQLKTVDEVVAQLDNGIKTLRTFKAGLGEASGRLGNLKTELDRLMKDTGAARKLEEVRAQVSSQIRTAVEPLANQVTDTIRNALVPLNEKLEQVQAGLEIACASIKLGGGGDQAKDLCKQAKAAFVAGLEYLTDFKERPAKLFDEVTAELEKQFELLIDAEVKKAIDVAQVKVNEALKLPPPDAGSGSGSAK